MAEPLIPPSIAPGDTIGIVAPSGQIHDRQRFEAGVRVLQELGFVVKFPRNLWPGAGYFADTDKNRVEEFSKMWADQEIKAVMAARGGFGCLRILEKIDLTLIKRTPKLFIGFSDITVLQTYLQQETGLMGLHGPVLTSLASSSRPAIERFYHSLTGKWKNSLSWKNIEVLRGVDSCEGILAGGNLSSIASLLGTPFQPKWQGKIVFLEDTGEPLYRIDRMLTQLLHAGMFQNISGLILGDFSIGNEQDVLTKIRNHEGVWQRVLELTFSTGIPVWGGFPTGHCSDNLCLPIGARALMDSSKAILHFF